MSTSNHSNTQGKHAGIDYRLALQILNERQAATAAAASETFHEESKTMSRAVGGGCPCQRHATPQGVSMGQIIHLTSEEEGNHGADVSSAKSLPLPVLDDETKKQRRVALEQKLQSMSLKELLITVMEIQEQRVATYRTYESGLETVLKTGNMTHYPQICTEATASFAVLSETIKMIQSIFFNPAPSLSQQSKPKLGRVLADLQRHEKEKLQLTAALHLERLRLSCLSYPQNGDDNDNNNNNSDDKRTVDLVEQGVRYLKQKLASCIENINDSIDEIRFAMMDEE